MFATTVGADKELDAKYRIDPNDGGSFFRLFIDGSDTPVRKEETEEDSSLDLETWIAHVTHFVPQPDYVTLLTTSNYNSFFENNKHRSVLVMYYMPSYQSSQLTVVQFSRAALAFRVVSFRLPFLDRSQGGLRAYGLQEGRHVLPGEEHHEDAHLHLLPRSRRGLRRTPAGDDARRGYRALPERGSRSVFLPSLIAGTHVSPKGGFDEQFGRHPALDRLAHLFMTNVATRGCVEGRRIPTSVVAS